MDKLSSGADLKAARLARKWTQGQLATAMGLAQAYIAQLEGKAFLPAGIVSRATEVFSINPLASPDPSDLDVLRTAVVKALDEYHAAALRYKGAPVPKAPIPASGSFEPGSLEELLAQGSK